MAFSPVLPDTPPHEVAALVASMLECTRREAGRTTYIPQTAQWLLTRALHWVVENAPQFIDGSARDEAALRHLQAAILDTARAVLAHDQFVELQWYHRLLLEGEHALVRPAFLSSVADLSAVISQLKHDPGRWRWLAVCRIYDVATANPRLLHGIDSGFVCMLAQQWVELCDLWPFFATAYPARVMQPILWMAEDAQ